MSRMPQLWLSFVLAAMSSGCDTMNWQQYRISGVHADSADAQRLKVNAMAVAEQYGLNDATQTSRVPNTLVFATESGAKQFHTDLGVRFYGDDAIVDVMAGFGPLVPKFVQVRDAVGTFLAENFRERCVALAPTERVRDGLASYR